MLALTINNFRWSHSGIAVGAAPQTGTMSTHKHYEACGISSFADEPTGSQFG